MCFPPSKGAQSAITDTLTENQGRAEAMQARMLPQQVSGVQSLPASQRRRRPAVRGVGRGSGTQRGRGWTRAPLPTPTLPPAPLALPLTQVPALAGHSSSPLLHPALAQPADITGLVSWQQPQQVQLPLQQHAQPQQPAAFVPLAAGGGGNDAPGMLAMPGWQPADQPEQLEQQQQQQLVLAASDEAGETPAMTPGPGPRPLQPSSPWHPCSLAHPPLNHQHTPPTPCSATTPCVVPCRQEGPAAVDPAAACSVCGGCGAAGRRLHGHPQAHPGGHGGARHHPAADQVARAGGERWRWVIWGGLLVRPKVECGLGVWGCGGRRAPKPQPACSTVHPTRTQCNLAHLYFSWL